MILEDKYYPHQLFMNTTSEIEDCVDTGLGGGRREKLLFAKLQLNNY